MHAFDAHQATIDLEHGGDPTIAVPSIITRVGDDRLGQRRFLSPPRPLVPLVRTDSPDRVAGTTLGYIDCRHSMLYKHALRVGF